VTLRVVHLLAEYDGRQTIAPFDHHLGFDPQWWGRPVTGGASHHWLSILRGRTEVARAKIRLGYTFSNNYRIANPPGGFTDIDLLEVRADMRGARIGTRAVQAIAGAYPGTRLSALSLNEDRDQFWSTLGWQRIPGPDRGYSTLFASRETEA
jgi:hypothetical protein